MLEVLEVVEMVEAVEVVEALENAQCILQMQRKEDEPAYCRIQTRAAISYNHYLSFLL